MGFWRFVYNNIWSKYKQIIFCQILFITSQILHYRLSLYQLTFKQNIIGGNLLYTAASIFSGGGFGDFGFKQAGFDTLVLCEKEKNRAEFLRRNYENSKVLCADVDTSVQEIIKITEAELLNKNHDSLFLLYATPPCQGISKNGIGTILKAIKDGKRPEIDRRNELYKPFLEMVSELKPRWIFFENVCRLFQFKGIDKNGNSSTLKNIIENEIRELGYAGSIELTQMADYGIPQSRLRSVGLFRKCDNINCEQDISFMPSKTHIESHWVKLQNIIGDLEPLDAASDQLRFSNSHKLHFVPKWRKELYHWMSQTPEGKTALDNTLCVICNHENKSDTIQCSNCKAELPIPNKLRGDVRNKIKGFPSSYRRIKWNKVAPTVTTRSAYACSDYNVHPTQNRVLSLLEIAKLQSIPHDELCWEGDDGELLPATLIRDLIGECVPTAFTKLIGNHIKEIENKLTTNKEIPLTKIANLNKSQLELRI